MKEWDLGRFSRWLMLACFLGLTGCDTPINQAGSSGSGEIKVRGVYTTIAMPEQYLDLPASGYLSHRSFSPGQTPAAVVVGYGDYVGDANYSQAFELRLVESTGNTVIQTLNSTVYAGKAAVISLPIRKGGKYQVQLVIRDSVADTWDFVVEREKSADTEPVGGEQPPPYAKGDFSVSLLNIPAIDAFNQYDDTLLYALNVAVYKEFKRAIRDDFAQMPAGHVTVQFDLDDKGQVATPRIVENNLSTAMGQFFLRALQNGGPYKAWPDEARAAIGKDARTMKVTFHYD